MGLARITRDTSTAYKGYIPTFTDTLKSTTKDMDYTFSSVQANHVIGDDFARQFELAQKLEPDLFTGPAVRAEIEYQKTPEYLTEAQSRPSGLPSNALVDIYVRNIDSLKQKHPDTDLNTIDELYDMGGKKVIEAKQQAEYDFEHSDSIAGTAGWLLGTAYGALRDPVVAISMLAPEVKAAQGLLGVTKAAVRTGLRESVIEAGIQANTAEFKQDIGVPQTWEQALVDIGSVGTVSFLMRGGGELFINGLKSRIKSGEIEDSAEIRENIEKLEQADDLISEIDAATPEELKARLEEIRLVQSEALAGNPINGSVAETATAARRAEAIEADITSMESELEVLSNERDSLSAAIDTYHADRTRLPELEDAVASKLSRAEKKQLKKEIAEALKEGDAVTARIQSRMDANYDLMAETDPQVYKKSVDAANARNQELRRPIEDRMIDLESRQDLSDAADLAENELRRLKVRIANDTFDPDSAAMRIAEIDETSSARDQELFGLQSERGELVKPKPEPQETKALDDAIEADAIEADVVEAQVPATGSVLERMTSIEDFDAPPNRAVHKPFGGDFSGKGGIMPTFQGGKQKMAVQTSGLFRKLWTNDERAKITQIDDYFGGGGGWGLYTGMTHFPNAKTIRLHEFDPARLEKIKFIHQKGDQFKALINSPELRPILDDVVALVDEAGKMSSSAVGTRIRDKIRANVDLTPDQIGALKTFEDYGSASFGTRVQGADGLTQVESIIKHLDKQFATIRSHMAEVEKRGIKVEYIQGNSYELPNTQGDHVLAMVDPPYYNTKGYPETKVPVGTYNETRKLLQRLSDNNNSVIYTDEAWFHPDKMKKDPPKDLDKKVDGLDAYGILNDIDSRMDHFIQVPIAGRVETLGVINGFRTKSGTKGGNVHANGAGRSAGTSDGRGTGLNGSNPAERVAGNTTRDSGPLHAAKLDAEPTPDLDLDAQVEADIAQAEALLANENIKIPTIDEHGNEVLRPINEVVGKLDDESLIIDRVLECGKQ